ncbi:MAG: crossover junction endodeoxyribonuclease RuvC [Nitrospinae bacterium RIFCSPLOWO2_12_FULL_45_22]|nr:MAG: crossover junction endodeoxyribonuclease RuvC [Nitrospinae bacterium RIFCSPLOWO2_12_FULL_45_22]
MRVLGIDPGTIVTGYGVVEEKGGKLWALDWGAIQTATDPLPFRLKKIYKGLEEILEKFKPNTVAVESIFYAKNVRSALKLGQARGIALLSAASYDVEVVEYTPLEVKQAVVGYGRAGKEQVQEMVAFLLGLNNSLTSTDASDALALAICHIHSYKVKHACGAIKYPPKVSK